MYIIVNHERILTYLNHHSIAGILSPSNMTARTPMSSAQRRLQPRCSRFRSQSLRSIRESNESTAIV